MTLLVDRPLLSENLVNILVESDCNLLKSLQIASERSVNFNISVMNSQCCTKFAIMSLQSGNIFGSADKNV